MKGFQRIFPLLLALVCAAALALPAAAAVPEVDTSKAVIDNADILSDETESIVTNISAALSDTCGAQIGVYTVDQVGNDTIEGYAYEVFNAWGLGDSSKDNGVMLLLAPGDDNYWAMQGSGLETQLPSSTLSSILADNLEPNWVSKSYDTGTQATVRALAEKLCTIYGVSMNLDAIAYGDFTSIGGEATPKGGGFPVVGVVVLVLVLVVMAAVLIFMPRFRGPGIPYARPRRNFFVFWAPRPLRPPRPPRPPRGPGYGAPRPPRGNFGGARPPRPPRSGFGGTRPGGSRPRNFRTGGGSTRGGGAGRRP